MVRTIARWNDWRLQYRRRKKISGARIRAAIGIVISASAISCQKPSVQSLPVQQIAQLLQNDTAVVVLDVRSPEEFRSDTGHLYGAILIPLTELEKRIDELQPFKHRRIVAYCRTGRRSERAAAILTANGFAVINMAGGINDWRRADLPVVRE